MNWKLAEEPFYNQGCKKDIFILWEGEKKVTGSRPGLLEGDSEEKGDDKSGPVE